MFHILCLLICTNSILFLVGIGWPEETRSVLENTIPFNMDRCRFELEFEFDNNSDQLYPRPYLDMYFADFAILNKTNTTFQKTILPMKFDFINFNWFVGTQNKMVSSCPLT